MASACCNRSIQINFPETQNSRSEFGNYLIYSNVTQFLLYILAAIVVAIIVICQKHKLCQRLKSLKKYNLSFNFRQSVKTEANPEDYINPHHIVDLYHIDK